MSKVHRYFDESIFTDSGFTFKPYDVVSVTNRVDAWLVEKLGKTAVKSFCTNPEYAVNDKTTPTDKIANLNPHIPCTGTNIYSLNNTALSSLIVVPFFQVTVSNIMGRQKPELTDNYDKSEIFTINEELSDFENAILIKYYSKKSPIIIDYKLYECVNKHMKQKNQTLFRFEADFNSRKLASREYRNSVINFSYTSPSLDL